MTLGAQGPKWEQLDSKEIKGIILDDANQIREELLLDPRAPDLYSSALPTTQQGPLGFSTTGTTNCSPRLPPGLRESCGESLRGGREKEASSGDFADMFWENDHHLGRHANNRKETAVLQVFRDEAATYSSDPFRAAAGRISPTNRLFWK